MGRLSVWVTYRTAQQWRRCRRLGKLLGMRNNEVQGLALNLAANDLQRRCDKAGIDWRKNDLILPDPVLVLPDPETRRPMIHD